MKNLINSITTFIQDEEGLTSVEYAVGAGFMAVAGTLAFTTLGESLSNGLTAVSDLIAAAPAG